VGRTVVAEVIIPDARFFEYLRAGEKNAAYLHWREKLDGRTLLEHAIEKIAEGLIDPRMAEKVVGHLHNGTLSAAINLSVVEVARAS
jgi:type II secretory ATPase GspE/PulE/Tfp pilus assembly ATPase PilB-like protein